MFSEQGALLPHSSFDELGIQGQLNTINLDSDNVVSHFNTELENPKILLYGSHVSKFTTTDTPSFGGIQTFSLNPNLGNIDAIGDIHIEIEFVSQEPLDLSVTEFSLHRCIDRLEFKIGGIVLQTLNLTDIYVLLFTKLNSTKYSSIRTITNPESGEPNYDTDLSPNIKPGKNLIAFHIPLFTMKQPSRAHLITGSSQPINIDILYKKPTELNGKLVEFGNINLFARHYRLTETERDEIRSNVFSKILHFSNNISHIQSPVLDSKIQTIINVDISNFSLLASHLLITMESQNGDSFVETTNSITPNIISANLLLANNGSTPVTHSSILSGVFMKNIASIDMDLNNNTEFVNAFLVSGDPPAGNVEFRRDVYVYPLATKPYGNDGCPFNKFDSITLAIKVVNFPGRVNVTEVGVRNLKYSAGNIIL
jgi:hypothetical protein